jgi:16S rRNA (adenine1518-N6/adenine1519-N6)-dimethyltransferase
MGELLRRAVVLVQLEVAERLTARPGTRDYGFLTVETNLYTGPEMLFRVPAAAFSPPPKVDSAAVLLTPRATGAWGIEDRAGFLQFAGRCFRHKRKTLRNNLLPFYGRQVEAWPEAGLRAEQLPLEKLAELYGRIREADSR